MFFFFICGEKTIRKELEGFEGVVCQCHHCGNMSGRVLKRRPFFTFCFIPLIPFTISGYKDISCHICNFNQPLEQRPDVQAMGKGQHAIQPSKDGQYPQPPPQQPYQVQGQSGYPQQQPPPQQGQGQQRYG